MKKFKIGDKVRITGTSRVCSKGCDTIECKYLNKIGTIKALGSDGRVGVHEFKGLLSWCSGFDLHFIELATRGIKVFGIVNFCNDIKKGKYGR